jgi:hypothetical protein
MKNYQKPMVNVEMINVEDVITASIISGSADSALNSALGATTGSTPDAVIVFEW